MSFFTISNNDIYIRTGAANQLFELSLRPFTIYKEPIKNINIEPNNPLYGYGDIQANNSQISYTPVYQTFSGKLFYHKKAGGEAPTLFESKVKLNPNAIYLKMKQDGFDYLTSNGKTESIKLNGETWKDNGKYQIQNYLGLVFYYVEIEATN